MLERIEDRLQPVLGDADTCILHVDAERPAGSHFSDDTNRDRALFSKFECVADEIDEDLLEFAFIRLDPGYGVGKLGNEVNVLVAILSLQLGDGFARPFALGLSPEGGTLYFTAKKGDAKIQMYSAVLPKAG